jgi:BirA family biotin operon repressor/biotin-[acetyl-CoA-carboxylase] ligase
LTAKIKPNTQIIGQNLVYFERLDSTNHLAMEMYKHQLIENGTVIYTDEQTQGRGQMQRTWQSAPYENLLFSIILMPVTNAISNPFLLNKCITLAISQFLKEKLPNAKVNIKWPNDLMVNNKKIAGVLIENSFSGSQISASIIGIGMNVNERFGESSEFNATSFADIKNEVSDKWLIFEQLLETLDTFYLKLINEQSSAIETLFNQSLLGYQQFEQFIVEGKVIEAKIIGCDSDGRLLLMHNNTTNAYLHGAIQQIIAA